MTFEIGDIVRITRKNGIGHEDVHGRVGAIRYISEPPDVLYIQVVSDREHQGWFNDNELQLVTSDSIKVTIPMPRQRR
jgi:hypothetical protein